MAPGFAPTSLPEMLAALVAPTTTPRSLTRAAGMPPRAGTGTLNPASFAAAPDIAFWERHAVARRG